LNAVACGSSSCATIARGANSLDYLTRAIIDYLEELDGDPPQVDPVAFEMLRDFFEWNLNICNFCYHHQVDDPQKVESTGTGTTLVDPQLWWYLHTGEEAYKDHVLAYLAGDLGAPPYGSFEPLWQGEFEGRIYALLPSSP